MGPGEDPGPRPSSPPSPAQPPGSRRGSGPALGLSPPGSLQALPPHLSSGLLPPTQVSLRALREAEGGSLTTALKLQGQKREAVRSENPRIPVRHMGKLRHEGHPPSPPEARTGAQGEAADCRGCRVPGSLASSHWGPTECCAVTILKFFITFGQGVLHSAPGPAHSGSSCPSRADGGQDLSVPSPSPQGALITCALGPSAQHLAPPPAGSGGLPLPIF